MYHRHLSKLTAALVAMLCLAQGAPATAAGEVTSMKETISTTYQGFSGISPGRRA